jgi:NADP-dependent 3-hydroxy acid dehydrogenase YdfG
VRRHRHSPISADYSPLGIGRHSAIALSPDWNVVLTGRRLEALEETKSLCKYPENCLVVAGEVTDEAFVKHLFDQAVQHFGQSRIRPKFVN